MKLLNALLSILFIGSLVQLLLTTGVTRAAILSVPDQDPAKVNPFAPADVRLLPGLFKNAQDLDLKYLLSLDPDRLLSGFRTQSGLKPRAPYYGGWESGGVRGQTLGHYLSALSFAYAATGDVQFRDRAHYCVAELDACQQARKTGLLAAYDQSDRIYDELTHGNIRTAPGDLNGGWVPWYTNHKVLAGLRDTYLLLDDREGRDVMLRFADWCVDFTNKLTDDQLQHMFETEYGGMNEVLADCYAITGDKKYLATAKRWYHRAVLDPLEQQQDHLSGLHANTQIPKLIGLARLHELTDDEPYAKAAGFFWDAMVNHHSFANGGNSLDEHLGLPDVLASSINGATAETCNVYNMLKLTRHLFIWTGDVKYAEYYERALYNQILASQEQTNGMVTYFQRFNAGAHKDYSTPFDSFWCCVGTGMENHVTYNTAIYYHAATTLYVNLFVPSVLKWRDQETTITQETSFPESDTTQLRINIPSPRRLTIRLRQPAWTAHTVLTINGNPITAGVTDGYLELTREFHDDDVIQYKMPMSIYVRPIPDKPTEVALFYGPVMLAGIQDSAELVHAPTVFVGSIEQPASMLVADSKEPLTFNSAMSRPQSLRFIPFYRTHHIAYQVYFDTFTDAEWAIQHEHYQAEQAESEKLQAATIDILHPGEQQSEIDHHIRESHTQTGDSSSGIKWRHVLAGGFLEYTLKVDPKLQNKLLIQWYGGDRDRVFDLSIDSHLLAEVSHDGQLPGQFLPIAYSIPLGLSTGRESVVFRLSPKGNSVAGGLFTVRVVAAAENVMPVLVQATDSYLPLPGGDSAIDRFHALSGNDLTSGSISSTSSWRQAKGELGFTLADNPMANTSLQLSFVADRQTRKAQVVVNGDLVGSVIIDGNSNDLWMNRSLELPETLTSHSLYVRVQLKSPDSETTPRLVGARLIPHETRTSITDFAHAGNLSQEAQKLVEATDSRSGTGPAGQGFRWRDAAAGGSLAYDLSVDLKEINTLTVFYFAANEDRLFHITVDGQQLKNETVSRQYPNVSGIVTKDYEIPPAISGGKSSVVVRFNAEPNEKVGQIMGLIMRH